METLRSPEADNWRLERNIWKHLEKKGLQNRDWGHHFNTIKDLRAQVYASSVSKAALLCKLTLPVLLLKTLDSSTRWSWPRTSLWRGMSVGSESFMCLFYLFTRVSIYLNSTSLNNRRTSLYHVFCSNIEMFSLLSIISLSQSFSQI